MNIVRVEMKLTKTGSFVHKNKEQMVSLQVKFALVKIRYTSEISLCSEIAIHSENVAIVAKFRYNSEIAPVAPACILHVSACILLVSCFNFFVPGLMQLKINHTNSV